MIIENAINIYADGSCLPHPRRGGIGIQLVIVDSLGQEKIEDIELPGYKGATNNQMELLACINGIKEAMHHPDFINFSRIYVHTDSLYICDNYNRALFSWSKNKWCNYDGRPVDNAKLWKELLKTVVKCERLQKRVKFQWVKGHSRDLHNKAADILAKQSAKNAVNPPLTMVSVRRKKTAESINRGCIPMRNQRMSIGIITFERLTMQRRYKYKYEVISRSSPYYGKVDYAYSEIFLKDGHSYSVRFNDIAGNPTIVKVFRELLKTDK